MNSSVVSVKISLLLEPLFADVADVLRRFSTLVVQVPAQTALVEVRSAALVTRKRLSDAQSVRVDPRERKSEEHWKRI